MTDVISRVVGLNKALYDAAYKAAEVNACVHYHLVIESYDVHTKDAHHGAESLTLTYSFGLNKTGVQSNTVCPTPNVLQYFKKRSDTAFLVSMVMELNSPSHVPCRTSLSFRAALGASDDLTKRVVNPIDGDSWTVELVFNQEHVLTVVRLHHDPTICPTHVGQLMCEAAYIEREELVALLQCNVALEEQLNGNTPAAPAEKRARTK
jgi:hypothetical protein